MTSTVKESGVQVTQLRAFVTVARTGSLTVAADLLGYTEPAVHLQLATLGRVVGGPLLVRVRRRMELTRLGEALLPFAETAVGAVDGLVTQADSQKARADHVIRVGLGRSVGSYIFPYIAATVRLKHPEIRIETSIMPLAEITDALERDNIDVGLVTGLRRALSDRRAQLRQFVAVPLTRYEWKLLASPTLREQLIGKRTGTVPVLVPDYASGVIANMEAKLRTLGQFSISVAENTEMAKAAALAGLAIAYIPEYTSRHELTSGELVRCFPELDLPTRTIDLGHRRPSPHADVVNFVSSLAGLRGFLARTPVEFSHMNGRPMTVQTVTHHPGVQHDAAKERRRGVRLLADPLGFASSASGE